MSLINAIMALYQALQGGDVRQILIAAVELAKILVTLLAAQQNRVLKPEEKTAIVDLHAALCAHRTSEIPHSQLTELWQDVVEPHVRKLLQFVIELFSIE